MISAKADIAFTPEGSIRVAHNLMKKGAHIYLYNGGFHHSKVMMIDSTFCTVGTANLDSRSLRYDYEVNAFIFDKEITEELSEIFEKDGHYRVTLKLEGEKNDEYTVSISLSGFFTFDSQYQLSEEDVETLITKNGIAILMPYLRNQLSNLTAQPNTDAVVLPIFNINNMLKK